MAYLFQRSASVKLKRRTKHTMCIRKKAVIKKGLFRYTIFLFLQFLGKNIQKHEKKYYIGKMAEWLNAQNFLTRVSFECFLFLWF
jgi:hypothetical protein